MSKARGQTLEVWGDFACFTRPELKVERFSYPIMTPSAARGVFDAIYAKPKEFRWQVTRVEMLRPVSYIALRRNEVSEKIGRGAEVMYAEDVRQQRQTMALREPRYRVTAEIRPWPGFEAAMPGLEAQFQRRAAHGKCYYQPYLGCREFAAYFEPAGEDGPAPVAEDLDIGLMLYDVFDLSRPNDAKAKPAISVFEARVRGGVMEVPEWSSELVLKAEG
jgi:CRISPR-associated protein Cas5d